MRVLNEGDDPHLCFTLGTLEWVDLIYALYARGPTTLTELDSTDFGELAEVTTIVALLSLGRKSNFSTLQKFVQFIGFLLIVFGILISLTGLGAIIGAPMIICGAVFLFFPMLPVVVIIVGIILYYQDRSDDLIQAKRPAPARTEEDVERDLIKATEMAIATYQERGVLGLVGKVKDCYQKEANKFFCLYFDVASRQLDYGLAQNMDYPRMEFFADASFTERIRPILAELNMDSDGVNGYLENLTIGVNRQMEQVISRMQNPTPASNSEEGEVTVSSYLELPDL